MKLPNFRDSRRRTHRGFLSRFPLAVALLLAPIVGLSTPALVSADVNPPVFVDKWGEEGAGEGDFSLPTDVAIDSDDNIYVVDHLNNRIQKFDSEGDFLMEWGSYGTGQLEFKQPFGIAVDSANNVYVTERTGHRVQKFNSSGGYVDQWGGFGTDDGKFIEPMGIAIDDNDNIYVCEYAGHRVQKFDTGGNFVTKWGSDGTGESQFGGAIAVATDASGNVYVADRNNHRVQKFSSTGAFLTKWGSTGDGDLEFEDLTGICVDRHGSVYTADETNNRIQQFDADGAFLAQWGTPGAGDGEFAQPHGLEVNASGYVCVADGGNHRVQVFAPTPWMTFLGGGGYDIVDEARGIAVDSEGYVYVTGESRSTWTDPTDPTPVRALSGTSGTPDAFVVRLFPDGRLDWYTFLGSGGFDQGYGIAVDNNGSVFVTGRSDASWSDAGTPVRAHSVSWDAFVARLDADDGDLVWHTFLGDGGDDWGLDIAANDGFLYVAGSTSAAWSEQPRRGYSGNVDAFAAKLEDDGDMVWHTFLGGDGAECNNNYVGVAVSDDGNAWVTSASASEWSEGGVVGHSGGSDAFVARLDSSGDRLWHTFMGSAQSDSCNDIAVDANGNAFSTGQSDASWGAGPVREHAGNQDGFAAKLDADGGLTWHTFIGGSSSDGCYCLQVDAGGNVYVAGESFADWGDPEQSHSPGTGWDVMAAKLSPAGDLVWHTFAGSSGGSSNAFALALNNEGLLHVAGQGTNSWGEPVRAYSTSIDGLVLQLAVPTSTTVDVVLDLKAGWNMVSVPLELPEGEDTVAAVFGDRIEAIYTWNPDSKSYETPDTIEPEKGYWVAVTENKTITVTGTPVTEWTKEIATGWNMIGSVHGGDVDFSDPDDGDGSVEGFCYWWNPTNKSYTHTTTIEPGKGYWAACTVAGDLTVGPPTPP